jgi:predicted ester cyclase
MPTNDEKRLVAEQWFQGYWGYHFNEEIVYEIAASNITLIYSLHEPRRGCEDVQRFMKELRQTFSELRFRTVGDLIVQGDCVTCRWEGSGVHSGCPSGRYVIGTMPEPTGRALHFSGATVLRILEGEVVEEVRLDDAETTLRHLKLLTSSGQQDGASFVEDE